MKRGRKMGYADLGVCGFQQRKPTVERLWKMRNLIVTLRKAFLFYASRKTWQESGKDGKIQNGAARKFGYKTLQLPSKFPWFYVRG